MFIGLGSYGQVGRSASACLRPIVSLFYYSRKLKADAVGASTVGFAVPGNCFLPPIPSPSPLVEGGRFLKNLANGV